MSYTWNTAFETRLDGSDPGSQIDDEIQILKQEIRKRLETFFDNWADDPDTPTTLDVKDDMIKAEHIDGLTGTGSVSLDNIPNGSSALVGVELLTADPTSPFKGEIWFRTDL